MENFGKFCFFILSIIIMALINGFVLMKLWCWFISPTFNIQTISTLQAMGLMIIIGFFKKIPEPKNTSTMKNLYDDLGKSLLRAGLGLLLGYLLFLLF